MTQRSIRSGNILPLLALATVLASCIREPGVPGDGRVAMVFEAADTPTKASVTPYEDRVESLDLLVFRSDNGKLDAYSRTVGSTRVTARISAGHSMHYHLVANAPEGILSGYTDEAAFLSGTTVLGHSTVRSLVMHGAGTVLVGPDAPTVSVPLNRYACKVSLQGVSVRYPDLLETGARVVIGRVALINAVGSVPWSGTPAAGDLWYNRMEVSDDGTDDGIADLLVTGYDIPVTASARIPLGESQYTLPNPTDNAADASNAPAWSPRNTRVALELLIDGVPNWYPVDLPAMRCNCHYVITTLTVLGPGAPGPDGPVVRTHVAFEVDVKEWGETTQNVSFD